MTAVAKLPGIIGSMLNFADVADRCELTEGNAPAAIRAWANQLAALSPAEMGDPVTADNAKAADSAALAMIGMGYAWDGVHWYQATPRAAEADWLPIESAPKDGQTILVGRDVGEPWGFVRGYAHYYGGGDGFVQGWISRGFTNPPGELGLAHPTHWRPLPAPPSRFCAAGFPQACQSLPKKKQRKKTP